jgi:hypothetical protein
MNWALIVTGSQRGQVRLAASEGALPCDPQADFLQWYERCLDDRPHLPSAT